MKFISAGVIALAVSSFAANAATMIQIGDERTWINADQIVALGSIDREQASRVRLGFLSVRGELDESVPDDAKFCRVITEEHHWLFAIDCREILEAIDAASEVGETE